MIEHPPGQAYEIRAGRRLAPQARLHMQERGGSFGHVEEMETETAHSLPRRFGRQA
ncbi:hypothetical protein [Nonomuraea jabiensis]|uniref:hypothetical protein n=1 Tax=Nonomuraea jabiensis TaxID=882448 RepID=UPI0036CEF4AF